MVPYCGNRAAMGFMIDLVRQLAVVIETQHPVVHCWACLARRLGAEEGKVRDGAQQLVITERRRFVLARRSCAGCEEMGTLLVFMPGT